MMRFTDISLETAHSNELRDFYTTLLGVPLAESSESAFTLKVGRTDLQFKEGASNRYHLAFNIPENQFEAGKAWLASKVPLVDVMGNDYIHFNAWNAHSVYFYDPAGNIMELIARHDLDNASEKPFSGESLLAVSEIGIATDDVRQFTQMLTQTCNVPVYDGDGSEVFSAIGDAEGLLIVVPNGREWFPETGISATACALTLTFESNQKLMYTDDLGYKIE
jgi:catechol-2,3-dioxygenase